MVLLELHLKYQYLEITVQNKQMEAQHEIKKRIHLENTFIIYLKTVIIPHDLKNNEG
jgi:hypothetical protein